MEGYSNISVGSPAKNFTKYGDSSGVKGMLYTDDVTIVGYTAANQTFGVATSYSTGFTYPGGKPDGLLGLGFPSISGYGATPVFDALVTQVFYIRGTNSQLYQGNFTYLLVSQEWHFLDPRRQPNCAGLLRLNSWLSPIGSGYYSNFWILGVAFLETVYAESEVGNKRLGFATPA
ncbi:Aspartic peptidase domain containing protein [Lactarius tabidus]